MGSGFVMGILKGILAEHQRQPSMSTWVGELVQAIFDVHGFMI